MYGLSGLFLIIFVSVDKSTPQLLFFGVFSDRCALFSRTLRPNRKYWGHRASSRCYLEART